MNHKNSQNLSATEITNLLEILEKRFEQHPERHKGIRWSTVRERLTERHMAQLWSLQQMEESGGEPDVIGQEKQTGAFIFCDCSAESPKGRRSLCFDAEALASRKEHKPADSAMNRAAQMGISMLTETEYRYLQQLGSFDRKTSSWVQTPESIRELGGALFCDRRYDHVFLYHNGAESYYAARGFRGLLKV